MLLSVGPELACEAANGKMPAGEWERALTSARDGDAEALGRLLEGNRQYLEVVANRRLDPELRAKADASDLVQQTFLETHHCFHTFRGTSPDQLRHWLRCILLRVLADHRRRYRDTAKREVGREKPLPEQSLVLQRLCPEESSPTWQAIRRERHQALIEALGRLPEHYQRVIHWRHQHDCSFLEIGRRLGRSADAARMLWWRAVEQLQEALEAHQ